MDCGVEAGLRLAEMGVNCICMLATCLLSFSKELPRRDHQKPAVSARGAADRSARLLHILSALVFPQRRLLLPSFLPSLAFPLSACPLNPMRSLSLSLSHLSPPWRRWRRRRAPLPSRTPQPRSTTAAAATDRLASQPAD